MLNENWIIFQINGCYDLKMCMDKNIFVKILSSLQTFAMGF